MNITKDAFDKVVKVSGLRTFENTFLILAEAKGEANRLEPNILFYSSVCTNDTLSDALDEIEDLLESFDGEQEAREDVKDALL